VAAPLQPSPLLAELAAAEQPPVELEPYMARLRAAGVVEVKVVTAESALHPEPEPIEIRRNVHEPSRA
jgi:hypothetical protein